MWLQTRTPKVLPDLFRSKSCQRLLSEKLQILPQNHVIITLTILYRFVTPAEPNDQRRARWSNEFGMNPGCILWWTDSIRDESGHALGNNDQRRARDNRMNSGWIRDESNELGIKTEGDFLFFSLRNNESIKAQKRIQKRAPKRSPIGFDLESTRTPVGIRLDSGVYVFVRVESDWSPVGRRPESKWSPNGVQMDFGLDSGLVFLFPAKTFISKRNVFP